MVQSSRAASVFNSLTARIRGTFTLKPEKSMQALCSLGLGKSTAKQ
jgi:hypothetical protein